MIDKRNIANHISFKGFTHCELIADQQTGPTCGFEALENLIQLFRNVPNSLTQQQLLPLANANGFAKQTSQGFSLALRGYLPILAEYGIRAQWYPFDHQGVLIPALLADRGVVLVADAHCLNPEAYPSLKSWHAVTVTNYYTDESGMFVIGYVGVDSNFPNQQVLWPCQNVESAAAHAAENLTAHPVLVTDEAGNWPGKAKFYRVLKNGAIVPVI